jgi:hypothetical protein
MMKRRAKKKTVRRKERRVEEWRLGQPLAFPERDDEHTLKTKKSTVAKKRR